MEWLKGIASGLIINGLVIGGILENSWVIVLCAAAGFGLAGMASWLRKLRAETIKHTYLAQYPSYKY